MGAPADGLHCGCMLSELVLALSAVQRRDEKLVIISSGRQLLLVEGPLQATYFLLVT